MKKYFISLVIAWSCMSFAAPINIFDGQQGQIDIAGGTAHIPIMKKAAQLIMTHNSNIRITVTGGGSGVGVQKLGEGLVQIGNTGRALKPSEIEKYKLVSFAFAIDGVAATVNPQNSVSNLTKTQLKDIFSGKITNWKALGGDDAKISLYVREDGSGTRETFESMALDNMPSSNAANVVNANGAMKTAIMQDKYAIGYIGIGYLSHQLKGLVIDGMIPSQDNAANGSYKITRELYMNTKGIPQGLVKEFIDYIYSADGAAIIKEFGYIPIAQPKA